MNFISRWFSKSPSDLLAKGDRYMESDSFFDARTRYEDGFKICPGDEAGGALKTVFLERIDAANCKLAELNLQEAEFAHSRGDAVKAIDHLELVKTLTGNLALRKKAEELILRFTPQDDDHDEPANATHSSCGSCSSSSAGCSSDSTPSDDSLPLLEYYELLIHQLPTDQYQRYTKLGEVFASAYVAASRDKHLEALSGFEGCADTLPQDIFLYEKGKVLHRLGKDSEAEQCLRKAVQLNGANSLAWVNLALVLRESLRFKDAMVTIETMIAENIMPEEAQLLRASIFEATGDHESAVNQYLELLQTPWARPAAEKLYGLLMEVGRKEDAAAIFKKYLKSCH